MNKILNFNRREVSSGSETMNSTRSNLSLSSDTFPRYRFSKLFAFSLVLKNIMVKETIGLKPI
ncbi:MAG: hypothetical protein Q8R96_10405 [Bacteroidota bacterium]|nr:hypothetical protein [Bacteroidota bacterium]